MTPKELVLSHLDNEAEEATRNQPSRQRSPFRQRSNPYAAFSTTKPKTHIAFNHLDIAYRPVVEVALGTESNGSTDIGPVRPC